MDAHTMESKSEGARGWKRIASFGKKLLVSPKAIFP